MTLGVNPNLGLVPHQLKCSRVSRSDHLFVLDSLHTMPTSSSAAWLLLASTPAAGAVTMLKGIRDPFQRSCIFEATCYSQM